MFTDMRVAVFPSCFDLFVGVEDTKRVIHMLDVTHVSEDRRAVHMLKPWAANESIIMLARDRATVFNNELIHLFLCRLQLRTLFRILNLHKWDHVEITVTKVTCNRRKQVILLNDIA